MQEGEPEEDRSWVATLKKIAPSSEEKCALAVDVLEAAKAVCSKQNMAIAAPVDGPPACFYIELIAY